jgi:hypothetical protein
VEAALIVFLDAAAIIATARPPLFSVVPTREGSLSLALLYETVTEGGAERLLAPPTVFLQICNLTLPPGPWEFCVSGSPCFHVQGTTMKSMILSVPSQGTYLIRVGGDGMAGFLATADGDARFDVTPTGAVVSQAKFVRGDPEAATAAFTPPLYAYASVKVFHIVQFACFLLWQHDWL